MRRIFNASVFLSSLIDCGLRQDQPGFFASLSLPSRRESWSAHCLDFLPVGVSSGQNESVHMITGVTYQLNVWGPSRFDTSRHSQSPTPTLTEKTMIMSLHVMIGTDSDSTTDFSYENLTLEVDLALLITCVQRKPSFNFVAITRRSFPHTTRLSSHLLYYCRWLVPREKLSSCDTGPTVG